MEENLRVVVCFFILRIMFKKNIKREKETSWGKVAGWYDALIEDDKSNYQQSLILPNLLRLLNLKKEDVVLDLACGQGFFSREFAKTGAKIVGVDIADDLIKLARDKSPKNINFFTSSAEDLSFLSGGSFDKVVVVLALQNIENVKKTLEECHRVLKKNGEIFIVMNHPAFRIPKKSSWGWDEENKVQYRRIDSYLFESKIEIEMNPGSRGKKVLTVSFHRPLQFYFKLLNKAGFLISGLEEWSSNKKSDSGPRANAENLARKEIPLFLFLKVVKQV